MLALKQKYIQNLVTSISTTLVQALSQTLAQIPGKLPNFFLFILVNLYSILIPTPGVTHVRVQWYSAGRKVLQS
jgi:hypothetical protein